MRQLEEDVLKAHILRTQLKNREAGFRQRVKERLADVEPRVGLDDEVHGVLFMLACKGRGAHALGASQNAFDGVPRARDAHGQLVLAGDGGGKVFRGVVCDDGAVVDDQHALADAFDLGKDMRGQHDRMAAAELLDDVADLDDLDRVKTDGRLVEDQHVGVSEQRHRKSDALLVAFGQVLDHAVADMADADRLRHLGDMLFLARTAHALELVGEFKVLVHGHVHIEGRNFRKVADMLLCADRILENVDAVDGHGAGSAGQIAADDVHRGTFPGAVGAEEADDFAGVNGKADVVDGTFGAVQLCKVFNLYHDVCFSLHIRIRQRAARTALTSSCQYHFNVFFLVLCYGFVNLHRACRFFCGLWKKSKENTALSRGNFNIITLVYRTASVYNTLITLYNLIGRKFSMSVKIGINGFGRIGRLAFRQMFQAPGYEVVAINDLTSPKVLAHLLKYDSAQGRYNKPVEYTDDSIIVDGHEIKIYAEKNAADLPWGKLDIDVVLECTGFYTSKEKASAHIAAGAKKVVISAPAGNDLPTIVYSVNEKTLTPEDKIISAASCTTNCLAPMADTLNKYAPIVSGIMTTVHAYTNDQTILDLAKGNLRRGRAAAANIVPTTTGAAKAIKVVIPELDGKLMGGAVRVPVTDGSLVDLSLVLENQNVTKEEINAALKKASETTLKEVMDYTEDEIVSSDILGATAGSVFDATQTVVFTDKTGLQHVKVVSWYDNEYSFTCQYVRLAGEYGKVLGCK